MKSKIITLILVAMLVLVMFAITGCGNTEEVTQNNAVENGETSNEEGEPTPPAKPEGGEYGPPDEGQNPKENVPPPDGAEIVPPSEGEENAPVEVPAE